jgi:Flp pilus assembly pilin Flp
MEKIRRFFKGEDGEATTIEALITGVIAAVIIVAASVLYKILSASVNTIATTFRGG